MAPYRSREKKLSYYGNTQQFSKCENSDGRIHLENSGIIQPEGTRSKWHRIVRTTNNNNNIQIYFDMLP